MSIWLVGALMAPVVIGLGVGIRLSRRPTPPPPPRPVILAFSGDTAGWITPCGCTANQSGGLPRRGSYLADAFLHADVVYADLGGTVTGDSNYQRLKFEAILAGEKAMGLMAKNIGRAEVSFDPEYLQLVQARAEIPFLSANARIAGGERLLGTPALLVTTPLVRILLIGVLSPRYATVKVSVYDPHQAIIETIAKYRGQYDTLVVLAYLPTEELEQLAADLPEADMIVGGPTQQAIAPHRVGHVQLASATNKGKFLIEFKRDPAAADSRAWTGRVIELNSTWADDATQLANVQEYQKELAKRDLTATDANLTSPPLASTPPDYRVAGSQTCVACHAAEDRIWRTTHHFAAVRDLEARSYAADPFCLQCHTTGYGLAGGFESPFRSAALAMVGCESCHGPSLAHVHNPRQHTTYIAANECTRCHDEENSPRFNYKNYWPLVAHGKRAATQPTTDKGEGPR